MNAFLIAGCIFLGAILLPSSTVLGLPFMAIAAGLIQVRGEEALQK